MSIATILHDDTQNRMEMPFSARYKLHFIPLVAVIFLTIYGQAVCPFIATLDLAQLVSGLLLIALVQILLREGLLRFFNQRSLIVQAPVWNMQKASLISWLLAGIIASCYHVLRYPNFPIESHLKLLTGYWALGAGILSQIDHVAVERFYRQQGIRGLGERVERISQRLMRLIAVFTLVPGLVMTVMAFRFVYEGYAHPGVAYEVGFLALVFFLVALLVTQQYGRALRKDTREISTALKTISAGKFDVMLDTSRHDELGQVAEGINDMAQGLALRERIRDLFGRFVNPAIAETVIREFAGDDKQNLCQHGQRKKVAVLMSDIRGFTPFAENMDPEALVVLLNGYFTEMVAAIQANGGMVDKFIGDAVMAVFGLAEETNEAVICQHAVAAAAEMQTRLKQYNTVLASQGDVHLNNGIGIHFGEVVAGYIGSEERLEFTVMGNTVNMAARVEGQCKAPNPAIMFTHEVAQHIGAAELIMTADLKGLSQPVKLYSCH
jgi:adenylate cyclase